MLTDERHDAIRARLRDQGKVLSNELAAEFGVSEDTVRRDLRELARAGVCRRVYGGALLPAAETGTIVQRGRTSATAKETLAQTVASLIKAGQTIFIDAGSTNLAVARAIPHDRAITVVTNAPAVALALSDHPRCKTIQLGGILDHDKGACLGGQTCVEIRRIHADLFILGTCAIDAQIGITALDAEEAEIKRAMIAQSSQLVVPVTGDKVGTMAPFQIAEPSQIDVLVVAGRAPQPQLDAFSAEGMRVLHAA